MAQHGGPRPGSGRPAGQRITRTQELITKATAGGITPLELLLKDMRFYYNMAEQKLLQLGDARTVKDKARVLRVVDAFKGKAKDYAVSAAPFVHPKLTSISAPGGGPVQISLKVQFAGVTN